MKPDKTRRAIVLSPLIALMGAVAILFLLSSEASAAWSSAVFVTTNGANDSDAGVNPTNGHVHMAWYDGTSFYWYAECDPLTNTCTNPVNLSNQAGTNPVLPSFATTEALRPGVAVDMLGNTYVGFPNPAVGPGSGGVAVMLRKAAGATSFTTFATLSSGWQVRLATDPSDNIHAVWGASGQLNYRKFGPAGNLLVDRANFTNGDGQGPHIAADAGGNAHIVYEGNLAPGPKIIRYQQITAAGNVGSMKTVYSDPNGWNSINPDVIVDVNGQVLFAWRDSDPNNIRILYQRCDPGTLANCTSRVTVNTDGVMGDDPSITTIGTNFYITYQQQLPPSNGNARFMMVYFGATGQLQQVDGQSNEFWSSIRGNAATGEINLVYRLAPGDGTFNLLYRHQNCNCVNQATATPTSTATNTPTTTLTPTNGPSPTPSNTPIITLTPTVPAHGTPVSLTTKAGNAFNHAPSVFRDGSGDIVVAWQRDVGSSSKQIYARVAPGGGGFGPQALVGNNTSPSLEPYLFGVNGSSVYALFMNGSPYDIVDSVWNGANWSAITNLTQGGGVGSQDGVGVQASDGKIWVAYRQSNSILSNNTFAQLLGGATYQLSTSGSASPHPAIAAGANGQVYVAWTDKGPSGTGCCIKVSQWSGSSWVSLPNATNSAGAFLPSLAFSNGKLYAVWQNGTLIQQTVWNDSSWGTITTVNSAGKAPKSPKIFIPATGDVFVVWSDTGVIYLSKNGGPRRPVSTGVPGAKEPVLFVDGNDVPYIAFQNGNVWYIVNP